MMSKFIVVALLVLPVLLAFNPQPYCDLGECVEGQKMDNVTLRCIPCHNGTFVHLRNHTCSSCFPCDGALLDIKFPHLKQIAARFCIKRHECSDNKNNSRNCTESRNTLRIPNTTTSKAVPDDEITNVRNDLPTSETSNTVNETTVNPASNISTTAPPEAEEGVSTQLLIIVFSVIGALATVVIVASVIYKCRSRFCRNTNYHLTRASQPADTNGIKL